MTPFLLPLLCQPVTKAPLQLVDAWRDADGNITAGILVAPDGQRYPIVNGIPRFVGDVPTATVESFGDEWNHFNFTAHKVNWLQHTVANTFGSPEAFRGKVIVDAGGGSGAQSRWFAEYGAKHVIMLELSHSVDGVVRDNLAGLRNVDVVQCSIDAPPLRDGCIDGIVYCHNVIQHTPSVEATARALYALTAPGGEFAFNCYPLNDQGVVRWVRWHLVYRPVRAVLSRMPFGVILAYARAMATLRLVPGLGELLEKLLLVGQGDVPVIPGESAAQRLKRRWRAACLNTFDAYGSHTYQHHKRDDEIRALVSSLQPSRVLNTERYFCRPPAIGCALRLQR
jgi:uncharacterized protein YbaR (Trm112 family)/SAM-dependent methyltransferase